MLVLLCAQIIFSRLSLHAHNFKYHLHIIVSQVHIWSPDMTCWKWKSLSRVQLFATPWTVPMNSPGQNTGVGSLFLLQGIFPTQGSSPGLLHCRRILYQLSHKGSPRILEWVAYPFSRGSSWPGNRIGDSCTAGGFFTNWAIREALLILGTH